MEELNIEYYVEPNVQYSAVDGTKFDERYHAQRHNVLLHKNTEKEIKRFLKLTDRDTDNSELIRTLTEFYLWERYNFLIERG